MKQQFILLLGCMGLLTSCSQPNISESSSALLSRDPSSSDVLSSSEVISTVPDLETSSVSVPHTIIDDNSPYEVVIPEGELVSSAAIEEIDYQTGSVFDVPSYPMHVTFHESDYHGDPSEFSISIAKFALALNCNYYKEDASNFFAQTSFEHVVHHYNYNEGECSYCFATREMNGFYLVTVTQVGIGYNVEWADNVHLGESGDHVGLKTEAEYLLSALETYITPYLAKDVKILFTGYSKGAAVASLAAKYLYQNPFTGFNKDHIYAYCFSGPVCSDTPSNLPFVHDIYNQEDFVTCIIPSQYGLYRVGVSHEIGDPEHFADYIQKYYPDQDIPVFTPSEVFEDVRHMVSAMLSVLLDPFVEEAGLSLATREEFASVMEPGLRVLMRVLMRFGMDYLGEQLDNVDDLMPILFMAVLSESSFHSSMKNLFNQLGLPYTSDEINDLTTNLYPLLRIIVRYRRADITALSGILSSNMTYIARQHFPTTCLAFLLEMD